MVFQLPNPKEFGIKTWSHDWHPYDDYLNVHNNYMTMLENEGLVINNNLSVLELGEQILQTVSIKGTVQCVGGVVVSVDKKLDVQYRSNGRTLVKGSDYTYQAWLETEEKQIIRYDMAHSDGLHCHLYNLKTGKEVIKYIDLDELPSLELFIRIALDRAKIT